MSFIEVKDVIKTPICGKFTVFSMNQKVKKEQIPIEFSIKLMKKALFEGIHITFMPVFIFK